MHSLSKRACWYLWCWGSPSTFGELETLREDAHRLDRSRVSEQKANSRNMSSFILADPRWQKETASGSNSQGQWSQTCVAANSCQLSPKLTQIHYGGLECPGGWLPSSWPLHLLIPGAVTLQLGQEQEKRDLSNTYLWVAALTLAVLVCFWVTCLPPSEMGCAADRPAMGSGCSARVPS